MSRLYFTESGNVVPTLCEELADYRRARKVLVLPGTRRPASLYMLARAYPGSQVPMHIAVNGTEIAALGPAEPDIYLWYELTLPPGLLVEGRNTFDFWTDSRAMNAWALGMEHGFRDPGSYLSTDFGGTWRNEKMGFLNVGRGEYVVRTRLAEGQDSPPPPVAQEDLENPRVQRLLDLLPDDIRQPGPFYQRLRKLMTWVCTRWEYRHTMAPVYAPWDAETIIAWGRAKQGHDGRDTVVMCVHYAVVFTTLCNALGIPARCAAITGSINGCNGHFVSEVWFADLRKWVMVDANMDAIFFKKDVPLSIPEIRACGDDVKDLISWGPGHDFQIQNPLISHWIPENYYPGICFRRRSIWRRTDFLSHPEFLPAGHGSTSYSETDLVWEAGYRKEMGMFPYFGDEAYFEGLSI